MSAAKRKKKSARERGYLPMREVAAGLRSLAAQMEQDNKGRLAKVSLSVWYEDPEPETSDFCGKCGTRRDRPAHNDRATSDYHVFEPSRTTGVSNGQI